MTELTTLLRRGVKHWPAVATASALALCAFAINFALERRLDSRGVFEEYNLLFDSDPIVQLASISHGTGAYGRNFIHPNFANFTNTPVRLAARVVGPRDASAEQRARLRRSIGLLVVPVVSAFKGLAVFACFYWLGLSLAPTALLTALSVVSFSQLVFGSTPDHFALSGLAIALGYLLVIDLAKHDGRVRWWAWIGVAVLATGTTITNLIIVSLLLWVALYFSRREIRGTTLLTGRLVVLAAALTVAIALGLNTLHGTRNQQARWQFRQWVERHVGSEPIAQLGRFPAAVTHAVAPPAPRVIENRIGKTLPDKLDFQFSLTPQNGYDFLLDPLGIGIVGLAGFGAVRGFRAPAPLRAVTASSLAVLGYNWVLHGFWGQEYFLYSQHFQLSILMLMAVGLFVEPTRRVAGSAALTAIVVAVAWNNAIRLRDMFATLDSFRN